MCCYKSGQGHAVNEFWALQDNIFSYVCLLLYIFLSFTGNLPVTVYHLKSTINCVENETIKKDETKKDGENGQRQKEKEKV
jgi:hypothetical protein